MNVSLLFKDLNISFFRVSGIHEDDNENTDDIVLHVERFMDVNLYVGEIDGNIKKPKSPTPSVRRLHQRYSKR